MRRLPQNEARTRADDPSGPTRPPVRRSLPGWLAVYALVFAALPAAAMPALQEEYPTEPGEALRYYEGQVDDWLRGPVEYLVLQEERDEWQDLETTEERQGFINWFWARRNPDPRKQDHKLQLDFYERVATSNQRFRGFPRGWKSDRGRVWITLGPPDSIGRRTSAQLFGVNGPDFTVWTYYTTGRNRGFSTNFGEFSVYFIESRPGQPEIFDLRFGAGSWPINLRRAFDYQNEAQIVDPNLEFDPEKPDVRYVREVSRSEMPLSVPVEALDATRGVGGVVLLPVRIGLGDLLFQSQDDRFVARLDVEASLAPTDGGQAVGTRRQWTVALSQEDLVAHGTERLTAVLAAAASPGTYEVRLGVLQPLAESRGLWSGQVEVEEGGAIASTPIVGSRIVKLDPENDDAIAIVAPSSATLEAGADVVLASWVRGTTPDISQVGLLLVGPDGEQRLAVAGTTWHRGPAGPLVIEARLPELDAGDYELIVDLGDIRSGAAELQIIERR